MKNKMQNDLNRRNYQVPGNATHVTRPKNAIYISTTNTLKHELAKCIGAYMIKKHGDIKFSAELIDLISKMDAAAKEILKDFPKDPQDFITEAVPKISLNRRIDIVRLSDETWYEFETDHKIEKGDCVTIKI